MHPLIGVGADFADHPEVMVPYDLIETYETAQRFVPVQSALNVDDIEIRPYTAAFENMIPGAGVVQRQLGIALMTSRSRGRLALTSANPWVPPRIDYGYLSEEADRRALRNGIGIAREVLGELAARGVVRATPVPDDVDALLGTSQHMTGTCRMGSATDEGAVVDERCAVIGLDGLSVVDTSIIPTQVSRGVHATAVMVAERAADLIV